MPCGKLLPSGGDFVHCVHSSRGLLPCWIVRVGNLSCCFVLSNEVSFCYLSRWELLPCWGVRRPGVRGGLVLSSGGVRVGDLLGRVLLPDSKPDCLVPRDQVLPFGGDRGSAVPGRLVLSSGSVCACGLSPWDVFYRDRSNRMYPLASRFLPILRISSTCVLLGWSILPI